MNDIIPLNSDSSEPLDAPRIPVFFNQNRRRTGKIARLPRKLRHKVNELIEDGVSYLEIIHQLGTDGEGITEDMLSKWKNSGYYEWLEERRIADAMRARYEFAHDLVTEAGDAKQASRAVLNTIAANLVRMLTEMDPAALREDLLSDADKFSRFVNAMVRLAEGTIKFDEHTTFHQERQAALAKARLPREARGISAESLALAEARLNLL